MTGGGGGRRLAVAVAAVQFLAVAGQQGQPDDEVAVQEMAMKLRSILGTGITVSVARFLKDTPFKRMNGTRCGRDPDRWTIAAKPIWRKCA